MMNMEKSRQHILMIVAGVIFIVVASLMVYIPAMLGGYIWDDDVYVERNSLLSSPDGLLNIWSGKGVVSQYVPMVYTTFRLEYSLWGLRPFGYHLTNILLHIFNALLIWLLLSRLKIRGAWLVSAIFALHPVHVESVAWITERKNVLSLFFALLSAIAYCKYAFSSDDELTKGKREIFYKLSIVMFMCALASKAVICFFPFLLLIMLWWKNGRIISKDIKDLSRFFILSIAWGSFIIWWEHNHIGTGTVDLGLTPVKRILIASHALWFYIGKLFYPVNLSFSYPKWHIEPTNPMQYIWLFLCLAAFLAIWHWRKKLGRGFIAAIVLFIVALSPMLGFFSLYTFVYTYVADHYQYVASIGIIVLVVNIGYIVVNRLGRYAKGISMASVAIILLTLGTLTWRQCHIYKDRETLWLDIIHKNPDSSMAHINLAAEYEKQGKFDETIGQLKKAMQLKPDDAKIYEDIGWIYVKKTNFDEAESYFRHAMKIEPNDITVYNNLGLLFMQKGDFDKAICYFQQALQIMPEFADLHINLGNAFRSKGDFNQAMNHYSEAIRIKPDYAVAHYNLGYLLEQRGKLDEAIQEYIKTLEINPNFARAKAALVAAQSKKQSGDIGTKN
jgi:tetratricopeptide (TPR) repeat protein